MNASTTNGTAVELALSCTDVDGDTVDYAIASPPTRGLLGPLQPGAKLIYAPFGGLVGTDTFSYRGTAFGEQSDPAAVTISVTNPPPTPTPTPTATAVPTAIATAVPTAAPTAVPTAVPTPAPAAITIAHNWGVRGGKSSVKQLTVKNVPAGAKVVVRCIGTTCPFKSRTATVARGTAKLIGLFKHRRMAAGVKIEIRITKAGSVGHVVSFVLRKKALPKRTDQCLRVGAAKPSRC